MLDISSEPMKGRAPKRSTATDPLRTLLGRLARQAPDVRVRAWAAGLLSNGLSANGTTKSPTKERSKLGRKRRRRV
jgi:hypothetical protein